MARVLLSSYPRDDYADPDGFAMQLTAILADYRAEIIAYVCSPRTGLQRKLKFKPSLAEVIEACEEHARHLDTIRDASKPRIVLPRPVYGVCNYEDMLKKHGRPVGRFEHGREFP